MHRVNETHIGALCEGRRVTPADHERWEQQRLERKRRRWYLDPYRPQSNHHEPKTLPPLRFPQTVSPMDE